MKSPIKNQKSKIKNPLTLAIVIEKFQPAAGGNERSTEQIARRLVERGHGVTVLTNRTDPAADLPPGGRVVGFGGMDTKSALGLRRFIRWAERELDGGGYDVSMSMTTAVPAAILQPRGGTVREALARNAAMRPSPLKRSLKRMSLLTSPKRLALLAAERTAMSHPRVKKIVAISRYVADQLTHHYNMDPARIELIPNAAEIPDFEPAERDRIRRRTRRAMDLGERDVVFLFAARNPALKGVGALLEAMTRLVREQPRARLIVAGTLRHAPHRRIGRLGLHNAARWVGPTNRIDALYAAADVTVLPSWYDPSSKVVLESLLHGVPAISTLHNGASQWILSPDGSAAIPSPFDTAGPCPIPSSGQPAGRVIDSPRNIHALTAAMADLCDDEERSRCAAATRGLQEHITMDRHVDQLERLLAEVAECSV